MKINKLLKLSISTLLIINFIVPLKALAGANTKLVEVGSEEREALEECMVGLEQCIEEKDKMEKTLKSRIDDLLTELSGVKAENTDLKKQISVLQSDNSLLVKKIEELKKSVAEKKEPVQPSPKKEEVKKVKASEGSTGKTGFCLACKVGNVIGPIAAVPIGAVAGTVRGATNKSAALADKSSEALGNSLPGQLTSKVGGGLIGAVFGAVTGLFKGIFNGFRYGLTDPFSAESFSLAGDFKDYNPTDYSY